jgi:hypothetical protein
VTYHSCLGVRPASATEFLRVSAETGHLRAGSPRSSSLSRGESVTNQRRSEVVRIKLLL